MICRERVGSLPLIVSSGALVLAAGESRRLGSAKQLLPWGGETLLASVLRQTLAWPVDVVYCVLGFEAERILEEGSLPDVPVVINPEWATGMASSLRVGLDAMTRDPRLERTFIVMGDQPGIDLGVVEQLLQAAGRTTAPVVVPRYRYTWSNPVLVARRLWARLMSLKGDEGARRLLKAHPEWVEEVWFDLLPPRDVDTRADVEELTPRT